jgi:hypothetical protein
MDAYVNERVNTSSYAQSVTPKEALLRWRVTLESLFNPSNLSDRAAATLPPGAPPALGSLPEWEYYLTAYNLLVSAYKVNIPPEQKEARWRMIERYGTQDVVRGIDRVVAETPQDILQVRYIIVCMSLVSCTIRLFV